MAETADDGAVPDARSSRRAGRRAEERHVEPSDVMVTNGRFRLLGRLLGLAFVASTALWLFAAAPDADVLVTSDLGAIAEHMRDGETYPPELLAEIDAVAGPVVAARACDARGLQNLATIRVARVETAIKSDDPDGADRLLNETVDAAKRSLACNPGSAVSWTILAWAEFIRNDSTPQLRAYLDMSYKVGPYVAWALLRRTELFLHIFPTLDAVALTQLRAQFDWLLARDGAEILAEQYMGTGEAQQAFMRDLLSDTTERNQKRVAEFIRRRGGDIVLPLVEPMGARPWK